MIFDFLLAIVMTESIKQRYCIKFCQKQGNNQTETIQDSASFGDEALNQTQIKEWFNRFKNGRMSVESEARSGRQFTSRNEEVIGKVCQILMEDRRLTLRKIVEEVAISIGSIHSILTGDLWRFYVAFVMLCEESGQTYGQGRTDGFTMTMLPFIPLM